MHESTSENSLALSTKKPKLKLLSKELEEATNLFLLKMEELEKLLHFIDE